MNMRGFVAATVAALVVIACGSSPNSSAPQGPTVASVAVQASDLPSGMRRCDLSGDVNSFLNKVKTSSPSTYASTKAEWAAAQKRGATAAEVVFFADSTANCKAVGSGTSQISSATYKLVVNFVFQFKDEATAAKGYTTESIFGFSQAQIAAAGSAATVGTKTGLGPNSVTLSAAISNQAFYIAVWQKKAFLVILAVLNIDSTTSQKVAVKVNGRIQ
jgi:hypothetical protein